MSIRKRLLTLAGAGALLLLTSCGGIQGSHSVSPATFLIPALDARQTPAAPVAPIAETTHRP
ncbi:MAG TPA: hypothetical protein PLX89_07085 [Verrucomicrobiota bacterium]|nr:hypothetical protein [Verrucomicrobiales bacterium]HRI12755.1 hypothetical protein [Verrucomicrobiota bacterium]